MLLDTTTTLTPGSFTVGLMAATGPTAMHVSGVTILVAPQATAAAAATALKSLRGFRTDGRRIAWCNLSELARTPGVDLNDWGRRLVDEGGAEMVVVCGTGGRDAAAAARDAGLALGRVVVCRDEATARNVLGDSIVSGDTVLALGIGADSCQRLADRLESKFARRLVAAR
jgi:hypothetical protein